MTRRLLAALGTCALAVCWGSACSPADGQPSDSTTPGTETGRGIDADVEPVEGVALAPDVAALSPDGSRLVVPCRLDDLCVWDTRSGALEASYDGGRVVAWSPDGEWIATAWAAYDTARVDLLDASTGERELGIDSHDIPAQEHDFAPHQGGLAFSPGGELLAGSGDDGVVRLWSLPDGELVRELETRSGRPGVIVFSPDGERLAVASPDEPVEVWSVEGGGREGTLDAEPQGDIVWSPDGDTIVSATHAAGGEAVLRRWDATSLDEEAPVSTGLPAGRLALSPDGATLALSRKDGPHVVLVPLAGGAPRELVGHADGPRAVLWAPDGATVYSISARDGVWAWDVPTGEVSRRFELPAP